MTTGKRSPVFSTDLAKSTGTSFVIGCQKLLDLRRADVQFPQSTLQSNVAECLMRCG